MFTRIVELSTKPGENRELSDSINDKVVPILKKQKSFVDETVLVSDTEANRIPQLLENQRGCRAISPRKVAMAEFNQEHQVRKISPMYGLRHYVPRRYFDDPWVERFYMAHILDHEPKSGLLPLPRDCCRLFRQLSDPASARF